MVASIKSYSATIAFSFPFAVYYQVDENSVLVKAVLDCRRHQVDEEKTGIGITQPHRWVN